MVTQFYEYTKYHLCVHFQEVHYMLCKLSYNKTVKIDIGI